MDLEVLEKWSRLSDQIADVLIMWHGMKNKQLAETFYLWHLRLVRERSALGLNTDEAWKLLKSEVINARN